MIKANRHPLIVLFFDHYVSHILRKDFNTIYVEGNWDNKQQGSLIIGNHISWWDGFFGLYLNNRFLKKKFHILMLEKQLSSRKMFSRAGAFSIQPGTKGVTESLDYASSLLENPQNSVLIFPQGILHSIYNSTMCFEKGIKRIIKHARSYQLLFYVVFIDYFSERKPSLFFYLKEVSNTEVGVEPGAIEKLYQQFYNESLANHSQKKE